MKNNQIYLAIGGLVVITAFAVFAVYIGLNGGFTLPEVISDKLEASEEIVSKAVSNDVIEGTAEAQDKGEAGGEDVSSIAADYGFELNDQQIAIGETYLGVIKEIKQEDPDDPISRFTVVFQDDIDVRRYAISYLNQVEINKKTSYLRQQLGSPIEHPDGCTGLVEDDYFSLDVFQNIESDADMFSDEVKNAIIGLYKDSSVEQRFYSELGDTAVARAAIAELISKMEDGTYHPLTILDICSSDGEIQVARFTAIPSRSVAPDLEVLTFQDGSFASSVFEVGVGQQSIVDFLPKNSEHGALWFVSEVLPLSTIQVWGFYELDESSGSFEIIETCVGNNEGELTYSDSGSDSLKLVAPGSTFVWGCKPEFKL